MGYVVSVQHTFGSAVEKHRKRLGLTFRAFSEAIHEATGVSIDSGGLNRIESGQREPRLSEALAIAQTLGVSLGELTGTRDSNVWYLVERMKMDLGRVLVEIENFNNSYYDLGDVLEGYSEDERAVVERATRYGELEKFAVALLDAAAMGSKHQHFLLNPSKYFPGMK